MNFLLRFVCLSALMCAVASAKAVRPPTELKVKVFGANSFLLEWKDNSEDENGWEILASVGAGSEPARYFLLNEANLTSYLVISNDIPGKLVRFQVRAYRGAGEEQKFSKPTSIVDVEALSPAVFLPPQKLRATAIDDGSIRIRWKDLSTTEAGYFVEFRKNDGKWEGLGNTGIEKRYNLVVSALEPKATYDFRVRAFKGTGAVVTEYSNESTAKTAGFQPPVMLTAKAEGEGRISLSWKDKSSLEEGYEIQAKSGDKKFKSLGNTAADATSTNPIDFDIRTTYQFRVRGFRTVDKKKVYSKFSEIVTKRSSGLAQPTDLAVSASTESSVTLTWKDASAHELGYTLRHKEKGAALPKIVELPAGATTHTITGLEVGKEYEFQVRAFDAKTVSRYTPVVIGSTKNQFIGTFDVSLTAGVSFAYDVEVTSPSDVENVSATGLPAGLELDEEARSISGIASADGVYEVTLKVEFSAGYEIERTLVLRVVAQEGGPEVATALADIQVQRGANSNVSLNGKFRDSDVTEARRFTTNLGTFDVVLFETATPATVANFLAYADGDRYRNTFFHRAPTGFVVQGGGFTYNGSAFGKVSTFAPVQNEPGISNLEGTVAMAKLGGDPNSATSQFFINLSDSNASNLDNQNGGFTVFGRIAGDGMDLFEDIDAMPKGNYTISPDGADSFFEHVPVQTTAPAPSTLDPASLVRVTDVAASPILRFAATSLSPAVATVSIDGNTLQVTGVVPGTARIRVRATDLDGLFADQLFDVTVP